MVALVSTPSSRFLGVILMGLTAAGYSIRRNCGLKWILVVLTFEGALRVTALGFLSVASWSQV
jgi:hypothetical protein